MASITDKITKTMDGQNPNTTSVSTQRVAGATELKARNLDGWPEETGVHFTTYRTDSQGEVVEGSETNWFGLVSRNTNTIANLTRTGGAPDQGSAVDDVIEAMPTAAWANDLAEALLRSMNPDGTFKDGVIPASSIDPSSEYVEQLAVIDFNDAKFLRPGKWAFRSGSNVGKSSNKPSSNAGWLTSVPLNPKAVPGSQPWGYTFQQYSDLTGAIFVRLVKSGAEATNITYEKWSQTGGVIKASKSGEWHKRVMTDGTIEYALNGMVRRSIRGSGWANDITIELPKDISSFNGDTMAASINAECDDSAVIANGAIFNGDTSFRISRHNRYGSEITTNLRYNARIIVYPVTHGV